MAAQTAEERFHELYLAQSDAIFRHCYYRLEDRERARDMVQETFLRTWQYLSNGHAIDNLRAFLYRVANNLIIDDSRKRQALSLDLLQADGFEPANDADRRLHLEVEAAEALTLLKQLGPDEREVILLRYVDGLKPKEIAHILDESPNVISVRLHRAMKHLQKVIHHDE